VLQHARAKFSCRSCEAITQPPAPITSDCARPRRPQSPGRGGFRQVLSRCTGRAHALPPKASSWTPRCWPTRPTPLPSCCGRSWTRSRCMCPWQSASTPMTPTCPSSLAAHSRRNGSSSRLVALVAGTARGAPQDGRCRLPTEGPSRTTGQALARGKLPSKSAPAKAVDYMPKRWPASMRFPRPRPHLPDHQRRRAGAARHRREATARPSRGRTTVAGAPPPSTP
jgi:hypothetical protein